MLMPQEYKHVCIDVNKSICLTDKKPACNFGGVNYAKRLKQARKHKGLTQAGLASAMNNVMSQQAIQYLENSDATGSEFTVQLARACGVDPMWLATGQGDMVDGLYVEDVRIKHIAMVCESLPDYAVDQLVQQSDALAELIEKAKATKAG